MAHWISSKLKAAETLLQQIDQQAADSLGKNDKPQLDDQLGLQKLPRTPEAKPLIKDQLKKKAPENVVNQSINHGDKHNLHVVSRSNSDINRDDEARISLNSNVNLNTGRGLTDSDWTELLSVPDKRGSSNGVLGNGGSKTNGKKVRTSRSGLNPSAVDGRSERGRKNGSLKSLKNSNVGLANNTNVYNNEKPVNSANVTPRSSSVQSPSSGVELDQVDNSPMLEVQDNINGTNFEKIELNGTVDIENDANHSSRTTLVSQERKLDVKVGLKDGEKMKSRSATNGSRMKKVPSLPSSRESNSDTDTTTSSDSESEREREERRKRRQQILAEKAAVKAVEAIKERENLVAKLEGEKQSLEKIVEERGKQQVKEASELQTITMETMEAVDLEKQKHNNTRMEAFSRLAKLERENADLARSLAKLQKNLEVEVDRVAELCQQIHLKEANQEELRRQISVTHQNGDKLLPSKGVEFELEMLKTECSLITDKVGRLQEKAKTLKTNIETTRREIENPTEVEIELKRRLSQLTDHLIHKQAQVETLSSEKSMLHFRIEAVSRMLEENEAMTDSANFAGTSSIEDLESGVWQLSNTKLKPFFKQKMQSGQQHFGSLVRQLDSLYCTGAIFIRRNSTAKIWSIFYLVCLHIWVMYILMSHSSVSDGNRSGAAVSLESINNTVSF